MAPFNRGSSRGGGKGFGSSSRGGGSSRGGRGGSRGGRGGFSNGRSASSGGSAGSDYHQQGGYYDQQQQQHQPQQQPSQDYGYDQYYQQQAPGSAEGEQYQQYDANAYQQQQYYDYSQQPPAEGQYVDASGVAQDANGAVPPGAYPPAQEASTMAVTAPANNPAGANGDANGAEVPPVADAHFSGQGADPAQLNNQFPPTGSEAFPVGATAGEFPPQVLDQTGCWVDRRYHDEIAQKLTNLKQNYNSTRKKYDQLKENYKQLQENSEKKSKHYQREIKKLQKEIGEMNEKRSISIPGPEGEGEVQVDAENVQYKNKEDVKQTNVIGALKAEREFYKGRTEKLSAENKKLVIDKSDALTKSQDLDEELTKFKEKYLVLEAEKESLESKLSSINNDETPKSPVLDADGDKDIEGEKSLAERKEYYKNKYLKLLEEKNQEQQNFLQINNKLVEKLLLSSEAVKK